MIEKYGRIVNSGQIFKEAQGSWDYKQAKNLVTKLVNNGWLIRIKRGLYAISDLSSRGFLSLSPYVVANLLVPDSYVSFEAALWRYMMFNQLPRKTVSISLKTYKSVKLNGMVEYSFIKTKPDYYFGWKDIQVDRQTARVATPEKALVDLINFHKSRYSIDLVIETLIDYQADLDLNRLSDYLSKFPIKGADFRNGCFGSLIHIRRKLYDLVKPVGTHWMLPGDGKFNAKWRLYYREYFDKYQVK